MLLGFVRFFGFSTLLFGAHLDYLFSQNKTLVFLQAPTSAIVSNAGYDGALVVGKLLEQDDRNFGFDAAQGTLLSTVGKLPSLRICNT